MSLPRVLPDTFVWPIPAEGLLGVVGMGVDAPPVGLGLAGKEEMDAVGEMREREREEGAVEGAASVAKATAAFSRTSVLTSGGRCERILRMVSMAQKRMQNHRSGMLRL
jgi:hypothetical protein